MTDITPLEAVSEIAEIVTAIMSIVIALMVLNWTRKSDENTRSRSVNVEMQEFNQMILADEKLLEIEAINHPAELGEMEAENARKMYLYFCWLNMADNIVRARDAKLIDVSQANARLTNISKVLSNDAEFIKKHVLPRGYTRQPVIDEVSKQW